MPFPESKSESEILKEELVRRCWQITRSQAGREISGSISVKGCPFNVQILFDSHNETLRVQLDAGMFIEEVVFDNTHGLPVRWIMTAARDHALPVLRRHMVLDDMADA